MKAKSERFEMRLDAGILGEVDEWRFEQGDLPNRSEAIRRLIGAGISSSQSLSFEPSGSEKLLLMMICEIYKQVGIVGEFNPAFIEEAVYRGHCWALKWKYGTIFHDHERDPKIADEVFDILKMWSAVERCYGGLSVNDRARIQDDLRILGDDIKFPGFDGNSEGDHLSTAGFMINNLGHFPEFSDRALLNSHSATLPSHRRMLESFTATQRAIIRGNLTVSQLIDILAARKWGSEI